MIINNKYSFNSLAAVIASLEWESRVIDLSKLQFHFNDADVRVEGEMIGTFDRQKQTYEQPEYNDLVDVDVEILSIVVSGEQREIVYNWEEKEKLAQTIKKLLI